MSRSDRRAAEVFTLSARIRSVRHAIQGIGLMLRTQHNAWIHALATVGVILTGVYFGVSVPEWCWLVLAIVSVWTVEALNTSLELLADVASPDFHPLVAKAKDVAAGAVLLAALGAVVIGILIFGPYLSEWVGAAGGREP